MRVEASSVQSWRQMLLAIAVAACLIGVRAEAQGKRTGSLLVLADSGATVYLDGQYSGMVTSYEDGLEIADLRPSTYRVVLRRSGRASEEFKVEVKRAQRTTLEKRAFRATPVPEAYAPAPRTAVPTSKSDTAGGVAGSERFVGLWREQRTGTFGNAHFNISFKDGKFLVQRTGDNFPTDELRPTGLADRNTGRSFGVVKLDGKVGHFGGTVSMSLVLNVVVRDPSKDLTTDTLAVQYTDIDGGGAKFEGSPRGFWVRLKR